MRNHGTRVELVHLRPHDHIGWVYSGDDEFVSLASSFLAEGAACGQRLMYVAESPDLRGPLASLVASAEPGSLQVASIAEVYGPSGIVDAIAQRATFAAALDDALTDGYSGIRVAADNTALVVDPERLGAWMRWELIADHFMSEHPVTGLCAFDRERVDIDVLRHLSTLHPLSSAASAVPQFRFFVDGEALCVEGDVDRFAVEEAWMALENVPRLTEMVVDLTKTSRLAKSLMSLLHQLSATGVSVTVRGATSAARAMAEDFEAAAPGHLAWVNA